MVGTGTSFKIQYDIKMLLQFEKNIGKQATMIFVWNSVSIALDMYDIKNYWTNLDDTFSAGSNIIFGVV